MPNPVKDKSQLAEPGPGWGFDKQIPSKIGKSDSKTPGGEMVKDGASDDHRERRQSQANDDRYSRSPTRNRHDSSCNSSYNYSSYNRRSRSRESARSFVRPGPRKHESRSPPKRTDDRSNTGRYDYITKRNRSPSLDSYPALGARSAPPEKRTMKSSSNTQEDTSNNDAYVTKTEFKSVMQMLFKCNRNYNNLLHMFVNDIAQRNMINSAVGGRDNNRTTYSSNQSSSREVKELTVAEMLLKSERDDEVFNTIFGDTKKGD